MRLPENQIRSWQLLNKAIDDADEQIPCTSCPDLFFPDKGDGESANQAKSLCFSCPVQAQCAIYAIQYETAGVWGGLTAVERKQVRKARGMLEPVTAESIPETFDSPVDPLFGTDLADAV